MKQFSDSFRSLFRKNEPSRKNSTTHRASEAIRSLEWDSEGKDLKVMCCTWNVGNMNPKGFFPLVPSGGNGVDLVAVGLQESTWGTSLDSNVGDVSEMLNAILGDDYFCVGRAHLLQMKIAVYAMKRHRPFIDEVEMKQEATGIGGIFGNKGGLAVSFRCYNTRLCFVSAHLAAHRGGKFLVARNQNVREIMRSFVKHKTLLKTVSGMGSPDRLAAIAHHKHSKKHDDVNHASNFTCLRFLFDHIIWMGDLNYRIDPSFLDGSSASSRARECHKRLDAALAVATKEAWFTKKAKKKKNMDKLELREHILNHWLPVHSLIETRSWRELYDADELTRSIAGGCVFSDWSAPKPKFPPTFKVVRGESPDGARMPRYLHQRVSSWCDRFLYASRPHVKDRLVCRTFESVPECRTSDHTPVRIQFALRTNPTILMHRMSRSRFSSSSEDDRSAETPQAILLRVSNISVQHLKAMDSNGLSDPFLRFYTLPKVSESVQTSVKKKTLSASWTESYDIRTHVLDRNHLQFVTLAVQVNDKDVMAPSQASGVVMISLKALLKTGRVTVRKKHLTKYSAVRPGILSFDVEVVESEKITAPPRPPPAPICSMKTI